MPEALRKADEVLQQAVQGITDLINLPALINLDFADVETVMTDKGIAHIGIGEARGDDKAMEAVQQAVSSPLLETTIKGATHVIINISGDISLMDANDAASYVQELTGEDANIIFGAMYDDSVADYARITVIATGLNDNVQSSSDAASYVQELTGEDANIIFGAMYDDSVADYARITVIATGLNDNVQSSSPFAQRNTSSPFAFGAMYDDSVADYARITVIATGLNDNVQSSSPFAQRNTSSPFAAKRQAAAPTQQTMNVNMPSFSLPTMNATPFGTKTPSSTVQKKDIQIPDFLKNR